MSMDVDAILFYGFILKEEDYPWEDSDEGESGQGADQDWMEKQDPQGWEVAAHDHCNDPSFRIQVKEYRAWMGHSVKIEGLDIPGDAEISLRHACEAIGINYEDQSVGWYLVSYFAH